jgi:hypothetical protein
LQTQLTIVSNEHIIIRGIEAGYTPSFIRAKRLATWKNYTFTLIDDF